jgi:hypothetical protein
MTVVFINKLFPILFIVISCRMFAEILENEREEIDACCSPSSRLEWSKTTMFI